MRIKSVKDVSPSDVVAADVHGENGTLLCSKGTTLTAATIESLRRHAVATVKVEGDAASPTDAAPLTDEQRAAIRAGLDRRFEGVERSELSDGVRAAIGRALEALAPPSEPFVSRGLAPVAAPRHVPRNLAALSETIAEIPTLSTVYQRFASVIASGSASAASAARVIEEDPGLTLRVIRMAGSSALARSGPVTTVAQAIVTLGFRAVQSIVLSSSTLRALHRFSGPDFEQLWRHAFAVGTCARLLKLQLRSGEPEEAFTMGLVHDMGALVLRSHFSDAYAGVLERLEAPGSHVLTAEREVLGVDHQQVGELIATKWRLPKALLAGIRHHHDPEGANDHFADVAVVTIADTLVGAMGLGSDGPSRIAWPRARCWEALHVTVDDVESACVKTLAQYREFHAFYGEVRAPAKVRTTIVRRPPRR